MYEHFKNMEYLYGDDICIQMPNDIFKVLSSNIKSKSGSTNIQQSSFAYAYIVVVAFLYKYAHFVDIDNETYIQNADIKEFLGYSKTTKSIDSIIKKDGLLDEIGLTKTIKNYPIRFINSPCEVINNIPVKEFITMMNVDTDDVNYSMIKKIVKNRNYEVKEPLFLFEYNGNTGTLYDYSNTHRVTIREVLEFVRYDGLSNIDFSLYCFLKSKCKGFKDNTRQISLNFITFELGIGKDALYSHLDILESSHLIEVNHKGWTMHKTERTEANEYCFIGIK